MQRKNKWVKIEPCNDEWQAPAVVGEIKCELALDIDEQTQEGEDVIEVTWSSFYHAFLYKSYFIDVERFCYYWRYKDAND